MTEKLPPGLRLASTMTAPAALGFVPVALHFNLFHLLVKLGGVASAQQLTDASDQEREEKAKSEPPLSTQLAGDTMFIMSGLGFVDLVGGDTDMFQANDMTEHIVATPSAVHGMLHFSIDALFAAPFVMRQLQATRFEYPFKAVETPIQFGYRMLGEKKLAESQFYEILHLQGRMGSFETFMLGKFSLFGTMPERAAQLGYNLDQLIRDRDMSKPAMVDVGGSLGEFLLEIKTAYPELKKEDLVLQDFDVERHDIPALTVMNWNFRTTASQPVVGARVYNLASIFHNMPDLDSLKLMQKLARAMSAQSRLLIQEYSKTQTYGKLHAAMMVLMGGRGRSSRDWHQMAEMAGLEITFEAYPEAGEGIVEMRKPSST